MNAWPSPARYPDEVGDWVGGLRGPSEGPFDEYARFGEPVLEVGGWSRQKGFFPWLKEEGVF